MLNIKNLSVSVDEKTILQDISLSFELGKNYCVLGKNGSGKSTLAAALMGHPKYRIDRGEVIIDGKNLLAMTPEDRSRAGLFLSFQNIPEIKGVRLGEYLRTVTNTHLAYKSPQAKSLTPFVFKRFVAPFLKDLGIPEEFLQRDLHTGFSGGEKRKVEMLQLQLIKPRYIILDEIDSGLDLDALRTIAQLLSQITSPESSLIIITHCFALLDTVKVDATYVLESGRVVQSGDRTLANEIRRTGYADSCASCGGKNSCSLR